MSSSEIFRFERLTGDTGTFDTLNDVSLTEEVENDQRSHNQDTTGIGNSGGIQGLTRVVNVEGFGNLDDIR